MKNKRQLKKAIQCFFALLVLYVYYILDSYLSHVYTVFLMFIIGFVFAYKERVSNLDIIDAVIFMILLILAIMMMYPPVDVLGIFTHYVQTSTKIISLLIFLVGYYTSYFLTKK